MSCTTGNIRKKPCRCCEQGKVKGLLSTFWNARDELDCECCGIGISQGWDYYELPDGTVLCDECMVEWMMGQYRRRCGEENLQ